MKLTDSITEIKGIGEKTALLFSKASVFCVNDIIHYFPSRYVLFPEIKNICDLKDGENAVIRGRVVREPVNGITKTGKRTVSVYISDKTSDLKITYFNMPYIKKQFYVSKECVVYGVVRLIKNVLTMSNPKILTIKMICDGLDITLAEFFNTDDFNHLEQEIK